MRKLKMFFGVVLIGLFVAPPLTNIFNFQAQGVSAQTGPEAMITLTFDDGNKKIWDNALPVMSPRGVKGVFYGETGPLNSGEDWVVTWDQVRALQNTYGWEIGSHSITHPYLTQISDEQLVKELAGSKADFEAQGLIVKSFATPYGEYDGRVLSYIAQYYESHRAAWGGANSWPYDRYQILALEVTNRTTPKQVKKWIDSAIANKQWLVLLFHEIVTGTAGEYQYNKNKFTQIVDAINQKGIRVVTISEGLGASPPPPTAPVCPTSPAFSASPNPIDEGQSSTLSFGPISNATSCSIDNGVGPVNCAGDSKTVSPAATTVYSLTISGGGGSVVCSLTLTVNAVSPPPPPPPSGNYITDWQPNDPSYVFIDNGSLKIIGGTVLHEAVSGLLPVNAGSQYNLTMNQSVTDLTAGGWAVWVDEFDAAGNYVSGQWLGGNYANFSGVRSYSYKPTGGSVAKISILLFAEKKSSLTLNANSAQLVKQ